MAAVDSRSQPRAPTPATVRLLGAFPALRRLGRDLGGREIPFVQQVTVTDCGAACLAMALGLHGREVSLDEVRTAMAVGRDGVSAHLLLETAAFYQLRGRGVRIDIEDLEHLPRGSILHWNLSHYVVFDRVDGQVVRIVDPAFGPRSVPRDEAGRCFTGVALTLERGDDFVRSGPKESPIRRHLRAIFAGTSDWRRVVVLSVLLQLLSLVLPMVEGRLIDRVVPRDDLHLLGVLCAGLATILVFHFLASVSRAQIMLQLRTRFDATMTFGFIDHLLRLPYAFFERRQIGDLQMRVGAVAAIREALTGAVLSGFIDGAMVLGHLGFLALMSGRMTLMALAVVSVQSAVFLATRRKLRDLATGSLVKQADAANALNELLAGVESLKASGLEHRASHTWAARYVEVMNIGLRQGSLMTFGQSILGSLHLLGPMVLLFGGVLEVMDRRMSLGVMMSANALAVGFLQPVMNLVSSLQTLQIIRAQIARIDDVRETAAEQEPGKVRMAPRLRGQITLDGVSFRYGPRLRPAVRDVSVSIAPGESIAIVGRSGSGKTTLGRLLLGLYQPSAGTVSFDGVPLAELDLGSVRRQLGVVIQKPHIFGTSIRANIALANPELPLHEIERAARRACIHEEIASMPMRYDTPVVAGGASLSGGQRQRLALARALAGDPAILMLDEATSALDAITEAAVQAELGKVRCTRVVVAHRLSTVIGADRILVMEDGAIVEEGRHHELLARRGAYANLVLAQLSDLAGTLGNYPAAKDFARPLDGPPARAAVALGPAAETVRIAAMADRQAVPFELEDDAVTVLDVRAAVDEALSGGVVRGEPRREIGRGGRDARGRR